MIQSFRPRTRALLCSTVAAASLLAGVAHAAPGDEAQPAAVDEVVVTAAAETRSTVAMETQAIQRVLPGASPLKAIQFLPGVIYRTADPWGNNEQNLSLFVHGFSTQQLGYTLDGVPLGDQQYGNYNGLSVSRAVSSENVARVALSSGAGSLGVASTSNLGGAIETFSRDPSAERGYDFRQTVGSYDANRTFLRIDMGETLPLGFKGYVSYLHQDQRAWDFNGHQRGHQVNLKLQRDDDHGQLTFYADWQQKVEPNEDSTGFGNAQTAAAANFTPYTRPFLYPDLGACTTTLTGGPGTPPPAQGNNFSNCFSAAQREDIISYLRYAWKPTENITWTNTAYYHYNYGRGIVAGPINTAGLPALFATYYPQLVVGGSATSAGTLTNIVNLFGGSGNAVRTTEYRINRGGFTSNLEWKFGNHQIEAGAWFEHNEPAQHRVWYPMTQANNDLTPYDVPRGPKALTQYAAEFFTNDIQLYIQDQWRIMPNLLLQAGVKASLQDANGKFPINQVNLPGTAVPVRYPTGSITSNEWFLPQVGALWDMTDHEQVFVNVQKNMRQFIPYGAGSGFYGFSAWSLGTQAAFDLFKQTVDPETSWTYEAGLRTKRDLGGGFGIDGQVTVYLVNFRDRLLNIAPFNFINPAPAILANVGGVTTKGIDIGGTLRMGDHFQVYNAISYNQSKYDGDYQSGTTLIGGVSTPVTVATGGKQVPLTPKWMNKTIARFNWGGFAASVSGDYIGRRPVTYLNDLSVDKTFVIDLEASYSFDMSERSWAKGLRISVNVVNLNQEKGVSTAAVTGNSGGYGAFPLAPRMAFVTLAATF